MSNRFLIINGPNLNLLGQREPHIYGHRSLEEINVWLKEYAHSIDINLDFAQSNHEGAIIDYLHNTSEYQGIVINPGALMMNSYSLRDAISSISMPVIEVHMSNVYARESFRHHSVISDVVVGVIAGFKEFGYRMAIDALHKQISR